MALRFESLAESQKSQNRQRVIKKVKADSQIWSMIGRLEVGYRKSIYARRTCPMINEETNRLESVLDLNVQAAVSQTDGNDQPEQRRANLSRRRLERIQEHLAATLDSPSTLQACIGPIVCDLMELCGRMKAAVNEALRDTTPLPAELERIQPVIEMYFRAVRQVDRLAQLDWRITESRRFGRRLDGRKRPTSTGIANEDSSF